MPTSLEDQNALPSEFLVQQGETAQIWEGAIRIHSLKCYYTHQCKVAKRWIFRTSRNISSKVDQPECGHYENPGNTWTRDSKYQPASRYFEHFCII